MATSLSAPRKRLLHRLAGRCAGYLSRFRILSAGWRLLRLSAEVKSAVRNRSFVSPCVPSADAVLAHQIPSVERIGTADRVLAEIDQDGYEFAVHPLDVSVFKPERDANRPRVRHTIRVVLRSGTVCLSKRFVPEPLSVGMREWLLSRSGLNFYTEAAAFVRLMASDTVPHLIDIDLRARTIYREFIRGERWDNVLARQGPIPAAASLRAAQELVARINREGVVLLDVNLANILVGDKGSTMYWIDFETARFREDGNWEARVKAQDRMLVACCEGELRQPISSEAGTARSYTKEKGHVP